MRKFLVSVISDDARYNPSNWEIGISVLLGLILIYALLWTPNLLIFKALLNQIPLLLNIVIAILLGLIELIILSILLAPKPWKRLIKKYIPESPYEEFIDFLRSRVIKEPTLCPIIRVMTRTGLSMVYQSLQECGWLHKRRRHHFERYLESSSFYKGEDSLFSCNC
jgi:hypothetical protein